MSERMQVVSAVIVRAGRVLLTQRDPLRSDYGWEWENPGGKVKPGETLAEAGARELREELDVDALFDEEPLARFDFSPGDEGGRVRREISVTFLRVSRMAGTPRAREAVGIGWFLPEELPGLVMVPATHRYRASLGELARASGVRSVRPSPAPVPCVGGLADHSWQRRPEHDGADSTQRFQCVREGCGVWGWRTFAPRMKPVQAYADGRREPDPTWKSEWRTGARVTPELGRQETGALGSGAPRRRST